MQRPFCRFEQYSLLFRIRFSIELLSSHLMIFQLLQGPLLALVAAGSASDRLADPQGIFVDIDFNLYVADNGNNRIQLFLPGQLNATTVAGIGAPGTITLAWAYRCYTRCRWLFIHRG